MTLQPTSVGSRVSAALVAGVAGYSSFSHIAHVALRYGERPEVAYALPFAIDGLLIVATTAMVDDKRHGRRVRWSARLAFGFGVTASLAANVASAHPSAGARVVAAVPAVTLLLAVEVLSRVGRPIGVAAGRGRTRVPSREDAVTRVAGMGPKRVVSAVATADASALGRVAVRVGEPTEAEGSDRDRHRKASVGPDTANRVEALLASDPTADTATVADALKISPRTARRYMAAQREVAVA